MVVVQLLRRPKAFALNKAQNMFPNEVSPWHPVKFMYSYFHTIFFIPCQRSHWIHAKHWVILLAPCGGMLGFLHIFAIFENTLRTQPPRLSFNISEVRVAQILGNLEDGAPRKGSQVTPQLRGRNLTMVNHWTQLEWSSNYAPIYTVAAWRTLRQRPRPEGYWHWT